MRYREIIEAIKNDDDMFSAPGNLATGAKQAIKQIEDPYLRTVSRVRELAKTGFGIKTRVSSIPKSASRGRATFWFGDYVKGPGDRAPKPLPVAQEIKAELERQGFECKFTGSGWLSVLVPPTYSDLLREENDDELFGSAPSAATLTQSIARAIVRSDKSARLITSPFMVGFALGKTPGGEPLLHYWKSIGKDKQDAMLDGINDAVYDLIANKVTENDESDDELFGAGGEKVFVVLAPDDEILNTFSDIRQAIAYAKKQIPSYLEDGWGDDDFISVYKHNRGEESGVPVAEFPITDDPIDESDDDMFGSSTRPDTKVIAQDLELWLRRRQTGSRRPLAQFEVEFVEAVIAGFNRSFLHGIHVWSKYKLSNTDIRYDLRNYIEDAMGVDVADHDDTVNENAESDEDLFGDGEQKVFVVSAPDNEVLGMFGDIREAIAHAKEQIPGYSEAGYGTDDFITVYKQRWNNDDSGVPVAHFPITDDPIDESNDDDDLFASPTIRFGDFFNEWDEDQLQALGFSYGDHPEQDVDIINHYLEDGGAVNWRVLKLTGAEDGQGDDIVLHLDRSSRLGEEESDDEMFGVSGSAAQRMIYKFGKQMLAKLEQAYNNPRIKAEYEKLTQGEEPDANRLFDLVCRSTSTPFGKAIVVDAILREYAGGFSGLNDFGTLIDSGEWHQDMVEMWDMFGNDPDVAQQDWFQKEIQTFMGDR